jgi:HAAS
MMTRTGLDHRLVRDYLRELDAAMAMLPAAQARELRAQITAHLDEALPPGAGDQDVAATLSRLGAPADLAADAGAAVPIRLSEAIRMTARARLARVSRRTWIKLGVAVVITGIVAGYLVFYLASGSLEVGPQSMWFYRQDAVREVDTTADGVDQTTVPIRSGQRQGFAVGIYNPTDVTQTIVGAPSVPGLGPDSPAGQTAQIAVSVPNRDINGGGTSRSIRFTLPAVIRPHQLRLLLVTWVSDICLDKGATSVMDQLSLRVRVGWFTRTEQIPLQQGWGVSGPSHGACD